MKKKSYIGPVDVIAEEKKNIFGLNTICAGFVVIIQLVFAVVSLLSLTELSFSTCV